LQRQGTREANWRRCKRHHPRADARGRVKCGEVASSHPAEARMVDASQEALGLQQMPPQIQKARGLVPEQAMSSRHAPSFRRRRRMPGHQGNRLRSTDRLLPRSPLQVRPIPHWLWPRTGTQPKALL